MFFNLIARAEHNCATLLNRFAHHPNTS